MLKLVIFVLDLSPCPILNGSRFLTLRLVSDARLSYPSRVLAREDLPAIEEHYYMYVEYWLIKC